MRNVTLKLCSLVLIISGVVFAQAGLPSSSFPAGSVNPNPASVTYTTNESGHWIRNYGNSTVGGSVMLDATLASTTANGGSTDATLQLRGIAKFLNQTKNAVDAKIVGHSHVNSDTTASLNVKVLGTTRYTRDLRVNSSFSWNPDAYEVTLPSISVPICTGISISIAGTLGIDGSVNGGAAIVAGSSLASSALTFSGAAVGWSYASATAGISVGFWCLSFTGGLQLTAQFAKTTLDLGVSVGLTGTTGTLDISVLPINLSLAAFATVYYVVDSSTWTTDPLVSYSAPAFNANLLSF